MKHRIEIENEIDRVYYSGAMDLDDYSSVWEYEQRRMYVYYTDLLKQFLEIESTESQYMELVAKFKVSQYNIQDIVDKEKSKPYGECDKDTLEGAETLLSAYDMALKFVLGKSTLLQTLDKEIKSINKKIKDLEKQRVQKNKLIREVKKWLNTNTVNNNTENKGK